VFRIRAWRARRKERKAEQPTTLDALSPKDSAHAMRVQKGADMRTDLTGAAGGHTWEHAGDEGKQDY